MEFELNWNSTKFNWNRMGCKLMEKIFKIFLWIWCWEKALIRHKFKEAPFHVSSLGNGLRKFQFEIIQSTTYKPKLCYLNQLWWIIFTGIILIYYKMFVVMGQWLWIWGRAMYNSDGCFLWELKIQWVLLNPFIKIWIIWVY